MTRRLALFAGLALAAAVGCGSPATVDGTARGGDRVDSTGTTEETTDRETDGETTEETTERTRPGVPGGPIRYDSTIGGAVRTIAYVTEYIESQLDEACASNPVPRCGVTIEPDGDGACVGVVTPNPVMPGGRITLSTEPCPDITEETTDEPTGEPSPTEGGG
ncbi:hypothetical protein GCM10023148_18300 [Actinokineospora soli]